MTGVDAASVLAAFDEIFGYPHVAGQGRTCTVGKRDVDDLRERLVALRDARVDVAYPRCECGKEFESKDETPGAGGAPGGPSSVSEPTTPAPGSALEQLTEWHQGGLEPTHLAQHDGEPMIKQCGICAQHGHTTDEHVAANPDWRSDLVTEQPQHDGEDVRAAQERAYNDGYNDAVTMSRIYGHTDWWPEEDEPRNPYRAALSSPAPAERDAEAGGQA